MPSSTLCPCLLGAEWGLKSDAASELGRQVREVLAEGQQRRPGATQSRHQWLVHQARAPQGAGDLLSPRGQRLDCRDPGALRARADARGRPRQHGARGGPAYHRLPYRRDPRQCNDFDITSPLLPSPFCQRSHCTVPGSHGLYHAARCPRADGRACGSAVVVSKSGLQASSRSTASPS